MCGRPTMEVSTQQQLSAAAEKGILMMVWRESSHTDRCQPPTQITASLPYKSLPASHTNRCHPPIQITATLGLCVRCGGRCGRGALSTARSGKHCHPSIQITAGGRAIHTLCHPPSIHTMYRSGTRYPPTQLAAGLSHMSLARSHTNRITHCRCVSGPDRGCCVARS